MILGPLERPTSALTLLRAYETGSDAHLPSGAGYLHLRAAVAAVARRADASTRRVFRVGSIEIDVFAREVLVCGSLVELPAKEFALLVTLAREPRRVFTKSELLREVWGHEGGDRTRTLDSHACRLRTRLAELGERAVINVWGVGTDSSMGRPTQRSTSRCATSAPDG